GAAPTPISEPPAPTAAHDSLGDAREAGAIDFVQRIGGRYNYSFIDGDTAYLLGGGQLLSVDIGEPAAPTVIDRMFMPVSGAFAVAAGHAYVFGEQGGMAVVDLGDPDALEVVSVYPPATLPRSWIVVDSQIEGQNLYLLTRQTWPGEQLALRIIDISNPANPGETGVLELADCWFYQKNHLSVAGGYAAVSSGGSGTQVNIINIADPSALKIVSSFVPDTAAGIVGLFAQAQRVYVQYSTVSQQTAIDVYDRATPAQPQKIGGYAFWMPFWLMAVEGDAAYIASEGQLRLLDFTVPSAPVVAGSTSLGSTYLQSLAVRTRRVVAIGEGQGQTLLSTFDFSNPAAARKLGRLAVSSFAGAAPMALSGDSLYAYETGIDASPRISQYSLANPLEPTVVITAPIAPWVTSMVAGDSALYMGNWANSITVVDRANLTAPPLVLDYPIANRDPSRTYWIKFLAARGKRAYALVDYKRLEVVDFTTPAAPRVLGAFASGDQQMAPVIAGDTAWFIDGSTQGSCIARGIDLSNPANLRVIGSIALAPALDCVSNVKLAGASEDVLYAWSDAALTAIDVSNPGAPRIQAALKVDTFINSLWVGGDFLYADTQNGVAVFDHATPDRMELLASIELGLSSSPEVPSSVMGRAGAIYRGGYGIVVLHWNPMIARGAVRQTNGLPFAAASIAASTGAVQTSAGDGAFLFKNLPRGPVTFTPSR
ncbi:MAG TPA: hypothetical protein VD886_19340, partial [Herpetosiphonaceae bacterium]|nr:hypothetical protein [Herpetosiphonaceae bacterium]